MIRSTVAFLFAALVWTSAHSQDIPQAGGINGCAPAPCPIAGQQIQPSWAFPFVGVDLNFAQNQYFQTGIGSGTSAANFVTVTRATTNGTATNLLPTSVSGQTITSFADNTARIAPNGAPAGLIVEIARVNQLLNATAPATQTTASIDCSGSCTLWVNGSGNATASAGTATGCSGFAAATNGSPNVFTCSGAGTITVTVAGSLNAFQLEIGLFGTSLCNSGASACSRGADVVTATKVPTIGAAYTMLASGTPASPTAFATNQALLNVSDGTNTNRGSLIRGASTGAAGFTPVGTGGSVVNFAFNGTLNVAPGLPQNVIVKGVVALSGASGLNTLNIGDRPDGALQWNGTVARVALWPQTALPASQLPVITQ